MYLYNEANAKSKFQIGPENRIGIGMYGSVFKINENTCLKVYKNSDEIKLEVLKLIKQLNLPNYYKLIEFYYNKNHIFKAHTMEYYESEEIDILTMPIEYSIDNISKLLIAVNILTQNNVLISDMHTENIIMNKNNITIIDGDLYTINRFYRQLTLQIKNLSALRELYKNIYLEALQKYHPEYFDFLGKEAIRQIFDPFNINPEEALVETLSKFKYPIDYVRKKVR